MQKKSYKDYKKIQWYVALAALSLFSTLFLPYVGEEAVYTISAYEMWFSHHYLVNTLYGDFYGRPPLLNWFIIPIAQLLGWMHALEASRLVSAFSTSLTVLLTYFFSKRITFNRHFSLLCAAIYLTGDLLFVRGWLAYADPLLSFFIFSSIVCLWLGVDEKRQGFIFLGVFALSAAFLTKALSPYWFYGIAGLVLLLLHPNRRFLFTPGVVVMHVGALTVPFLWNAWADPRYLHAMWYEATNTAFSPSLGKYFYQVLVTQPLMLLLRLLPVSVIALYYYFKCVRKQAKTHYRHPIKIAFWIALLNFAICWFAPRWPEARYYMPVLPLMALCMAYVIWNAGEKAWRLTVHLFIVTLVLKVVFVLFEYYQMEMRAPNYRSIAADVIKRSKEAPIYADKYTCQSAPVLKVAVFVNLLRYPRPPLVYQPDTIWNESALDAVRLFPLPYNYPPALDWNNGFLLGQLKTDRDTQVIQYAKGKRRVTLFCRGIACLKRDQHSKSL